MTDKKPKSYVLTMILCASCVWCDKWDTTKHDARGYCTHTAMRHMVGMTHAHLCPYWRSR